MTEVSSVDDRIAEIEAKAKQRLRKRMPLILLVSLPVGIVIGLVGSRLDGSAKHQHHHSLLAALVGGGIALICIAAGWLFLRRRRALWLRPSLMLGLDKQDRKRAARGLRRGVPDDDAVLREVQVRTARRLTRQSRFTYWTFPLFAALEFFLAITKVVEGNQQSAIFFFASTGLFLVLWPLSMMTFRGARRVLAATGNA